MPRVNLIFGPSWQNLLQWFNKPSPYSSQPLSIYLTWLKSKNWRLNEEAVQTVPSILDTQRVEGVTADSSRTAWQNDEPVVRRWKNSEQSVRHVVIWPLMKILHHKEARLPFFIAMPTTWLQFRCKCIKIKSVFHLHRSRSVIECYCTTVPTKHFFTRRDDWQFRPVSRKSNHNLFFLITVNKA